MASSRPRTMKYTEENMMAAYQAVVEQKKGLREAARLHGVPPSTLKDRLKGRKPFHEVERTVITAREEEKLVGWIKESAGKGLSRTKNHVRRAVQTILNERRAVTVFKDNLPGKKWVSLFLRRHRDVTLRTPQSLGAKQAPSSHVTYSAVTTLTSSSSSSSHVTSSAVTSSSSHITSASSVTNVTWSSPSSSHFVTAISNNSNMNSSYMSPVASSSPSSSSIDKIPTKEALDRLLDVTAKAGLDRLVRYRTLHSLGLETDDPEERLFCLLYSRLTRPPQTDDSERVIERRTQKKRQMSQAPKMLCCDAFRQYVTDMEAKKRKLKEDKKKKEREEKNKRRKREEKTRKRKEEEGEREREEKKAEIRKVGEGKETDKDNVKETPN